jgi:putative ABC transport system substrate-binding protein
MQRREFITLLGNCHLDRSPERVGAPVGRMYRLGRLVQLPRNAAHWIAFFDELRKQGFLEGVNLSVVDAFSPPLGCDFGLDRLGQQGTRPIARTT